MTDDFKSKPTPPTIEHLMAATGLGKNQCYADIRAGLLPGRMRKGDRLRWVCPPGEFAAYVEGRWEPKPQPSPVQMLRKRKA